MTRRVSILVAAALALAACDSADGPVLSVAVSTGLVPGPEFSYVETSVLSSADTYEGATVLERVETRASFGDPYARSARVADFRGVATGEVTLRIRLLRSDRTKLVERRVRVTFRDANAILVHLTRDCVGVSCPAPAGSSALSECLSGACVDPGCSPETPELCPAIVFCNDASECAATSTCAMATCVEGVCSQEMRAAACDEDEWCNPSPTSGCEPLAAPVMDSGIPLDAGDFDAGVDAMVVVDMHADIDAGPVCGSLGCEVPDHPCQVGYMDCSSGEPTCAPLYPRTPGTACGTGMVCDQSGACSTCVDGTPCMRYWTSEGACENRVVSCALGGVCVWDGTFADENQLCRVSASSSPGLCNGAGLCEPCVPNAQCSTDWNDCHIGERRCTGAAIPYCQPLRPEVAGTECRTCSGVPDSCDGQCTGSGGCVATWMTARNVTITGSNACAVRPDGRITCWGNVDNAPFGFDIAYTSPNAGIGNVPEISDAIDSTIHPTGGCALHASGTVSCWGAAAWSPGFGYTVSPQLMPLPTTATRLSGDENTTCARLTDGRVACWGTTSGHCGAAPGACTSTPTLVPGVTDALSVEVNGNVCAVLASGQLSCWGASLFTSSATVVAGIDNVIDVAPAAEAACAVRMTVASGSEIRCWGDPVIGSFGIAPPVTGGRITTPTTVPIGLSNVRAIRSVERGHCVLTTTNELWCWGEASGREGTTPTRMGIDDVVDMSHGQCGACFYTATNTMYCLAMCNTASNPDGVLTGGRSSSFYSVPAVLLVQDELVP